MKWMSNPEVKDKNGLQEARRKIEVEMERFKAFERESKTKPFSLMGLSMGDRLDANELKRQEKRESLEEILERLNAQADEFRAEWEGLTAKKKKNREETERIDLLKKYIDWHAFHIGALEQLLRRLDNGMIAADDLDSLIESLELFLEQFEDPDYYHDEGLYEQYNLASDAIDVTYYNPTLEDTATEDGKKASGVSATTQEPPRVREVPMTAAAKARAKKQAAREMDAAQTGGPVRPDHPAQNPPKPQRPATPTIQPPPLPTPPNPPNRPAPVLPGIIGPAPVKAPKVAGVWDPTEPTAAAERPPPPPPPSAIAGRSDVLSSLEASCLGRSRCQDIARVRPYTPSNPFAGLMAERSAYPDSVSVTENAQFFAKLPVDALAVIFYYREGTHAQFLASQELKRQNWRFHKKFGVWVKRVENGTKTSNAAFEYGTYQYLDPSAESWGLRLRNDFTFEYEYLEEESLPVVPPGESDLAIHRSIAGVPSRIPGRI